MLTPQQIIAALKVSSAVVLNNLTAPFNTIQTSDITNWTGLGLNPATDTAKLIFNILNPFGIPVYTNVGWNTSSFTSPDTVFSNTPSLTGPLETLPTLTGSTTNEVVSGGYTVQVQFQVIQNGGTPVVGQAQFTTTIQASQLLRCPSITGTYVCNTSPTTFTATDTTPLGSSLYNFVGAIQSITVTPPTVTGQGPTTASGNTVTIQNIWAPAPYQYNSSGEISYTFPGSSDTFTVNYTAYSSTDVVCNSILCKFYCWLGKITDRFNCEQNTTLKGQLEEKMILGSYCYDQCVRSQVCGDKFGFQKYSGLFIEWTDFDPNCSCCDNLGAAPVIPSGAQGPQGTNGLTPQFQVLGNWVQWKYTNQSAWTNLYMIPAGSTGPTGPTGPAGAAGQNGLAVLYNNFSGAATTSDGSFQELDKYTIPANTLSIVGSEITIRAVFTIPSYSGGGQEVRITFGGQSLIIAPVNYARFSNPSMGRIEFQARLVMISTTAIKYEISWVCEQLSVGSLYYEQPLTGVTQNYHQAATQISGLNFANSYEIDAQANSVNVGDIVNESLAVYYNQFS